MWHVNCVSTKPIVKKEKKKSPPVLPPPMPTRCGLGVGACIHEWAEPTSLPAHTWVGDGLPGVFSVPYTGMAEEVLFYGR